MARTTLMRKLEEFENPRIVPLGDSLYGASFFLMKLLPARFMLERAAERGLLKPGATICETTSGTFGYALAMLAVQHRYGLILVSDWSLDRHLHRRLLELGAKVEVIKTPHPTGGFQQARLERLHQILKDIPNSYWPSQYANPDNPLAYSKVAEQIIDTVGKIDCLVGPVGSGGSTCGTSRYLRALFPDLHLVGVDTPNSVLFGQPSGDLNLAGLGGRVVYENVDHTQFDEVHWLTPAEAYHATHRLHREHALFMGPTSGAAFHVAEWWAKRNPQKKVMVFFPDEGHRYIETVYDQDWLKTVAGWPISMPSEPIAVATPKEEMPAWSRISWGRRTLEQMLSLAEPKELVRPA